MDFPFFIKEMPLFFKIWSSFWLLLFLSLVPLFFIYRFWFFLRNPKRKIPSGNNIVSPADGYILYIKKIAPNHSIPISIKKGDKIALNELMDDPSQTYNLVIGIFMSPFSVHHNRFPIDGRIKKIFYRSTKENKSMLIAFLNLIFKIKPYTENADYLITNERNTIVLENSNIKAAIVQIATKWIDNIKNRTFKPGDQVKKGENFGMIRMGSQCDLYLNIKNKYQIKVKETDHVKAGKTILIEMDYEK